jgi:hypothetical protein
MNNILMTVQLWYAPLPFIGAIAVHHWFVVRDDAGGCHRWEVWQTRNAGGVSIGHVHCDLKAPEDGVGGGPSRLAVEWTGTDALRIHAVLSQPYPHAQRYRYWPGPNSNTFVAWVLRRAGIQYALRWRGIGRHWRARGSELA